MTGLAPSLGVPALVDTSVGRRALPVACATTIAALALAAFTLALVNLGSPAPAFDVHREFFVTDLALAALYAPFGALIVVRAQHPIGWAMIAVAGGFAVTAFAIQYAVLGVEHPTIPAYEPVTQLVVAGWLVAALTGLLVVPWLIDASPPTGLRRVAVVVGSSVAVLAGLSRYLIPIEDAFAPPLSGGTWLAEAAVGYDGRVIPCYALGGLAGAAHLGYQAIRSRDATRQGLAWMASSVALLSLAYLAFETGLFLEGPLLGAGGAALTAALVMLPTAVFGLVVRHPGQAVDLAVSRTVVGALLTAMVVAGYLVLVWAGGRVLPSGNESAPAVAVALLALGVMPARAWLQGRVDALVFGSVTDPAVLLDRLGSHLGAERDDRSILEGLLEGLRRSLRLQAVAVVSDDGRLIVEVGTTGAHPIEVSLHSRGHVVGRLRLAAPPGERLDLRTVRLVRQISGLVAVALDLALVNTALEQARGRLVDVRQEERRLLRRELHDGLGPTLAGAALALAAVRTTSALQPEDAALLGQLEQELTRRADDIRQMARVLLPPALDDGRLSEALQVLATRFSQEGFDVIVDAAAADQIDIGRQVALYHVAAEGVLNAFRHAGARRCHVELVVLPAGGVRLTVTDDGHGRLADATPGIGLASMRERAAELGGTFAITSSNEGVVVTVELP